GVAISARLLRRFQRLLRPGSMMADDAPARDFQVCDVIELHRSQGRTLEDDGTLRRGLRERAAAEHDGCQPSKQTCESMIVFHGASNLATTERNSPRHLCGLFHPRRRRRAYL